MGNVPTAVPLTADEVTELHAARLLLLSQHAGQDGTIHGLTKLAKLDFFVRYPKFFDRLALFLGKQAKSLIQETESEMVRHHYGPWDKRYYQSLAFLESRRLIDVKKEGAAYNFSLTNLGVTRALTLSQSNAFAQLIGQMQAVRKILGRKSGTDIKALIYQVFDAEVASKKLGEIIR